MNLVLSDKKLNLSENDETFDFIDLSSLKISNCIGCFGCWTKTPGKCVIRDDAIKVYPRIAASEKLIYITKVQYGSYDTVMKTMLERAIPIQQAFIRLHHGETHHVQRSVAMKEAVIIGYGATGEEEKAIFKELIERNAHNMSFKTFRILFAQEEQLEQTVRNEVKLWQKS